MKEEVQTYFVNQRQTYGLNMVSNTLFKSLAHAKKVSLYIFFISTCFDWWHCLMTGHKLDDSSYTLTGVSCTNIVLW